MTVAGSHYSCTKNYSIIAAFLAVILFRCLVDVDASLNSVSPLLDSSYEHDAPYSKEDNEDITPLEMRHIRTGSGSSAAGATSSTQIDTTSSSSSSSSDGVSDSNSVSFFSSLFSPSIRNDEVNDLLSRHAEIMKDIEDVKSSLSQINHQDAGLKELQQVSSAMDMMETLVLTPSFLSLIPEDIRSMMEDVFSGIHTAKGEIRKIEALISEYSYGDTKNKEDRIYVAEKKSISSQLSGSSSPSDKKRVYSSERRLLGQDGYNHPPVDIAHQSHSNHDKRIAIEHGYKSMMNTPDYPTTSFHSKFDYIHRSKSPHQRFRSSYGSSYFSSSSYSHMFTSPFISTNMDEMHLHRGQGRYGYYHESHGSNHNTRLLRRKFTSNSPDFEETSCTEYDANTHKTEECKRLADCARHYSLYDLFMYFYQDDIDIQKGEFKDEDLRDTVFDEIKDIPGKLATINAISNEIWDNWIPTSQEFLGTPGEKGTGKCDMLLQNFHRFYDKVVGDIGKWQGASVTSVCRGWGTTKYVKLGEIYKFVATKTRDFTYAADLIIDMFEEFINSTTTVHGIANKEDKSSSKLKHPLISDDGYLSLPIHVQDDGVIRKNTTGEIKKSMTSLNKLFVYNTDHNKVGRYNITDQRLDLPKILSKLPVNKTTGKLEDESRKALSTSFRAEWQRDLDYGRKKRIIMKSIADSETLWDDVINIRAYKEEDTLGDFDVKDGKISIFGILNVPYDRTKLCVFVDNKVNFKVDGETKLNLDVDVGDEFASILVKPGIRVIEIDFEDEDSFISLFNKFPVINLNFQGALILTWFDRAQKCPKVGDWKGDAENSLDDVDSENMPRSEDWIDPYEYAGISQFSFDTSIELLFGEKTTIGQVFSYANGIRHKIVDQLPGFCCLDAPYESSYWGEKYSCTYEYGPKRGEAKNVADEGVCENSLAPFTTSFNKAACDIFSGTWCQNARTCGKLACIQDMRDKVKGNTHKKAFFQYLDGAPKLKSYTDVKECSSVRQYFDYDPDYPDDERICEEVEELQCLSDFSDLDGLLESESDDNDELEELTINTKIKVKTKVFFSIETAKVIENSYFALAKTFEHLINAFEILGDTSKNCDGFIAPLPVVGGTVPGSAAPCVIPLQISTFAIYVTIILLKHPIYILKHLHSERVEHDIDVNANSDIRDSTYENVITSSQNIHTVFKATQQLKQMLGEIAESLVDDDDDDDDNNGRRLAEKCKPNDSCKEVSMRDPKYNCDCSIKYFYVAKQKNAGCDEFDSDGDGSVDYCEDRYPPGLLLGDPAMFRCDKDDPDKLCYNNEVFTEHKHAISFLNFTVKATDDCAPFKQRKFVKGESKMLEGKLGKDIELAGGSCHETAYNVTAWQDYPGCPESTTTTRSNETIPFKNPLYGIKARKRIYVQVDDEDPIVMSGFTHESEDSDVSYSIKEKTLFYYGSSAGGGKKGDLIDSNFFYKIDDNCPADIKVDVVVKSNELDRTSAGVRTMVELIETERSGFNKQVKLYYSSTSCDISGGISSEFCEEDTTIPKPIRFYDTIVTATDSSGRVGTDETRIIIVPKCGMKDKAAGLCEKRGNYYYYKRYYMSQLAHQSMQLYKLKSMSLVWKSDLESVETSPPTLSPAPTIGKGKGGSSPVTPEVSSPVTTHVTLDDYDDPSSEYLHDVEMKYGILTPVVKTCQYLASLDANEILVRCDFLDHLDGYDPAMAVCKFTCYTTQEAFDMSKGGPTISPTNKNVDVVFDDPVSEYLNDVQFKYGVLTPEIKNCDYLANMNPSDIEAKCLFENSYAGYEPARVVCPHTCEKYILM